MIELSEDTLEKIVPMAAIDERIDINLKTDGLSYEEIIKDTQNLICQLNDSIAKQTIQVAIYQKLMRRIRERMIKEDTNFKKDN